MERQGFGGGGGWSQVAPLAREEVAPDFVSLGVTCVIQDGRRGCVVLEGTVGVDVAFVEVTQDHETTRRAVEAPTGGIVVSAAAESAFQVRVLHRTGRVLATIVEPALSTTRES